VKPFLTPHIFLNFARYADYSEWTGHRQGAVSATRELQGLSGWWSFADVEDDSSEEESPPRTVAILHKGGSRLSMCFDGAFGMISRATMAGHTISFIAGNGLTTYGGYMQKDAKQEDEPVFQGFSVRWTSSNLLLSFFSFLLTFPNPILLQAYRRFSEEYGQYFLTSVASLTLRPNIKQVFFPRIKLSQACRELIISNPKENIPRSILLGMAEGASMTQHLADGEAAALIAYVEGNRDTVEKFRQDLEATGIKVALWKTSDGADQIPKARTLILLLDEKTRTDIKLVDFICDWAAQKRPIISIGMWASLYFGDGWDPTAKSRLEAALAGLNMTGFEALDKTGTFFHAVVKTVIRNSTPNENWSTHGMLFANEKEKSM
jgi:hypothetical protein